MPQPLGIDFLVISRQPVPELAALEAELLGLRPGLVALTPPPEGAHPAVRQERAPAGRLLIHETLARVDLTLTFSHHNRPVLATMPTETLGRLARGLDPAWQGIIRTGLLAVDAHAAVSDPDRVWCLRWIIRLVGLVAERLGGIVFDPAAQRLLTAPTFAAQADGAIIEQVALHNEPWGPETRWLHTHGLQKLGQAELELVSVPQPLETDAARVLRQVVEALAVAPGEDGPTLRAGMRVECDPGVALLARSTLPDADHAATTGRVRLVTMPAPGSPAGEDATSAIITAALGAIRVAVAEQDWAAAGRRLARILAAAPEDPAALAMRAQAWLAQGEPTAALDGARELEILAPDDARGPYCAGLALLALGRLAEALDALNRAIARDPTLPDPYEARARIHERLGHAAQAQADRARAATLRD